MVIFKHVSISLSEILITDISILLFVGKYTMCVYSRSEYLLSDQRAIIIQMLIFFHMGASLSAKCAFKMHYLALNIRK